MRLVVLGSNGTYPEPGRPASGYLAGGDRPVWLDAGPGTLTAAMARGVVADVSALVLTHVHGDHCLDALPLFNLLRYGGVRATPLPVLAPRGVAERLAAFIGAGPGHDFHRVFDFRTVAPGDEVSAGGLRLTFGAAVHPVPAVTVRVDDGERSLAYSGDTGPGGGLVETAAGADLLLCEATGQGRREEYGYPHHLVAAEAGAAARVAGARRLLVTHVAPTLDPAVSVREAAAEYGGPVEWAAPGLEVQL
ncbi:MAG: MBL fold metallo-hydrolase [Actinobacteria bacterium]|nr:MBL fold metallo-hydrolase [Actinomycetota bacterium]